MIEVHDLSKAFDGAQVLRGVWLTVRPGSVFGLIGPNGAGKTTLLRIMAGIYTPDGGAVRYDGRPVFENLEVKRELVFVAEEPFAYPGWTIRDLLRFYGALYPAFDRAVFDAAAGDAALTDEKTRIARLSKGQKKQLAMCAALSVRPRYLLLDEPQDGLDPRARKLIWQKLLPVVSENEIHVIVSSHNLRELEDVCDAVGILQDGQIRRQGQVSDLQRAVTKVQVSFRGELPAFPELTLIKSARHGRVWELIFRDDSARVAAVLSRHDPLLLDELPLTLEELFLVETEPDDAR